MKKSSDYVKKSQNVGKKHHKMTKNAPKLEHLTLDEMFDKLASSYIILYDSLKKIKEKQ